eukprot:CAMPEP_0172620778 /NCGR_PEP_ID=MMETSP1068-20121228/106219_1 /TAXON_ID=35684 /ORGANISM="Pseudopedinella elastica, Strain CCMP716" /LENGTH=114 /DNA_ID=CAMNT_0013428183 /DNA_START=66 /DNA_END=410 /DNA_ORIENTATION=+
MALHGNVCAGDRNCPHGDTPPEFAMVADVKVRPGAIVFLAPRLNKIFDHSERPESGGVHGHSFRDRHQDSSIHPTRAPLSPELSGNSDDATARCVGVEHIGAQDLERVCGEAVE